MLFEIENLTFRRSHRFVLTIDRMKLDGVGARPFTL